MLDHKPLSDNEVDTRLRVALDALGNARGASRSGQKVLLVARGILAKCLTYLLRATTPTEELWPAKPKKPKADSERD